MIDLDRNKNAEQILISDLQERFPLIDQLMENPFDHEERETLPFFFSLLAAVATSEVPASRCVVLEKTTGTAALTSILIALSLFKKEYSKLISDYTMHRFEKGAKVRVMPEKYVYTYDGIWEQYPNLFRLRVLGSGGTRSFPLPDILRLEPTSGLRPKGQLNSPLTKNKRSLLDELIGIESAGNLSIIKNHVLLLSSVAGFERILGSMSLSSKQKHLLTSLSEYFPWGRIGQSGSLLNNDTYQEAGEPLVATSITIDDMALACRNAERKTKFVIADGARGVVRNLQAYDDIADNQNLLILSSPDEVDELGDLRDRGCEIWRMSPKELLIKESTPTKRHRKSVTGKTVIAALNKDKCQIESIECHDELIERAALELEKAACDASNLENNIDIDEVIRGLFFCLCKASECCFGPEIDLYDEARLSGEEINRQAIWLGPELTETLKTACALLNEVYTGSSSAGQAKIDALEKIMFETEEEENPLFATCSPRSAELLKTNFRDRSWSAQVLPVAAITAEQDYSCIIFFGWPGERLMKKLFNLGVTQNIKILTYDFERKWLGGFKKKQTNRERRFMLPDSKLAEILGFPSEKLKEIRSSLFESFSNLNDSASDAEEDLPVFRFEERTMTGSRFSLPSPSASEETLRAKNVKFCGESGAFFSEWHDILVITKLVEGASAPNSRENINYVTVSDLNVGDYILFREGGDTEWIRIIAENLMGEDDYRSIRAIAESWKQGLRSLGDTAREVNQKLALYGMEYSPQTIRLWLNSQKLIGPKDERVISVIGRAARDDNLLDEAESIISAISKIRGAHLKAGNHLASLLVKELGQHIFEINENETKLDLGYGNAWVVQVGLIGTEWIDCPSNQANRLTWY